MTDQLFGEENGSWPRALRLARDRGSQSDCKIYELILVILVANSPLATTDANYVSEIVLQSHLRP